MERFEHLSMVGFLILGLALVRLVTNMTSLLSKDIIAEELEDEFQEVVESKEPHKLIIYKIHKRRTEYKTFLADERLSSSRGSCL